jgi:magnesium chelatase subunit D
MPTYPLTAIVGQDTLKQSLLLTAVNPAVGGVLIRGEKGTAKSTAVRALVDVLGAMRVVRGCTFSCDPDRPKTLCHACQQHRGQLSTMERPVRVVNLPLNATEDRVAGGIDFAQAIQHGRRVLSPGLLAEAHRGILYVDEVNLLDDHIVDVILDAAVSGENRLEREGISLVHPARFILVGTMNPEEGELRPQLLDRFGLCAQVQGNQNPDERLRVMDLREAFDLDPLAFRRRFQTSSDRVAQQIRAARALLPDIHVPPPLRGFIAELCAANHVAGHRADLVMEQAGRALAAWEGNSQVSTEHIRQVAPLVLAHRRREAQPPPAAPPQSEQPQSHPEEASRDEAVEPPPPETQEEEQPPGEPGSTDDPPQTQQGESAEPQVPQDESAEHEPSRPAQDRDQVFEVGAPFQVKPIDSRKDRLFRRGSGRRSRTRVAQKQGRYVKACIGTFQGDIAVDATLRAAAPFQHRRRNDNGLRLQLTPQDLRGKIREKRIGNFLLFVVDASGSMGARGRMTASKGAVLSLLLDAYQKRDRVAMISFRRDQAVVNLPPTSSVEVAARLLAEMPVGGRTPLSAGLTKTAAQVRNILLKDPTARPIVVFITDGKSNVALGPQNPIEEALGLAARLSREQRAQHIVIDTEPDRLVTFGLARRLATSLQADCFKIEDLQTRTLVDIVKGHQP